MGDRFEHEAPDIGVGCVHCDVDLHDDRFECSVRLRAEVERLRAEADCTKDAWDRDVAELHAAREEVERLRARVAELEAEPRVVIANKIDNINM